MQTRIVLCCVAALAAGCGGAEREARPQVVAAFYPLEWAVTEITRGSAVDVTNLTPPGSEPHDLELSARDVERIRAADVVVYVGGGFQPALDRALEGADGRPIDVLRGVSLVTGSEDEHREDEPSAGAKRADPHVWLDPVRFAAVARRLGRVLARPRAAARLARRIMRLHGEYERTLSRCRRRELFTSHAAFGYLAARYDLEQVAIAGLSPEAEPSARALERVVEEVRNHGATTVFFETLVSPKVAATVAREANVRAAALNPLEGLTEEELSRGEDYLSVMRTNLAALARALGCR